MTYRDEFPDYPPASLPPIPPGFIDESWHNDTCPSWRDETRKLAIYIDYPDATAREWEGSPRFTLLDTSDDESVAIISTDDWEAVLDAIDR